MSKYLKASIKVAISVLLFVCLFQFGKFNLSQCLEVASHANLLYLLASLILFVLTVVVAAWRWQKLGLAVGLKQPLMSYVHHSFVSYFFNLFLPASLGGDISRVYGLSTESGQRVSATYSVLADRVLGLVVLFQIAAVSLAMSGNNGPVPWQGRFCVLVIALISTVVLPFLPRISIRLLGDDNWLSKQLNGPCARAYWNDRRLISTAVFLSVLTHAFSTMALAALTFSLGVYDLPVWFYFFMYSCVALAAVIVPSLNGLGVREFGYSYFLTSVGVESTVAGGFAIMTLAFSMLFSVFGGLLFVLGQTKTEKSPP